MTQALSKADQVTGRGESAAAAVPVGPSAWATWQLAAAVVLPILAVLLFRSAWSDMLAIAVNDEESSHIFLVPIIAIWLAWVRREPLGRARPGGYLVGPAMVLAGIVVSSIGFEHSIQSFWHGGAVLALVGALATVTGWHVLVAAWPAIVVLVFLVPVPGLVRQEIALPMQEWTAQATEFVGKIVGFDIYRSGSVLVINGEPVGIAEACNGMRMVFALFLATYAFAFINPFSWPVRLLILVISPLLAIGANVLRLVPTVYLYGHASKSVAGTFHDLSGWAMVLIAFLAMFGVLRLVRWTMDDAEDEPAAPTKGAR